MHRTYSTTISGSSLQEVRQKTPARRSYVRYNRWTGRFDLVWFGTPIGDVATRADGLVLLAEMRAELRETEARAA